MADAEAHEFITPMLGTSQHDFAQSPSLPNNQQELDEYELSFGSQYSFGFSEDSFDDDPVSYGPDNLSAGVPSASREWVSSPSTSQNKQKVTASQNLAVYGPESSTYISVDMSVNASNAEALAALKLDFEMADSRHSAGSDGEARGLRRRRTFDADHRYNLRRGRRKRYQEWLKSSVHWKDGFGAGWEGIRVLGRGGYGLVGLWKWIGIKGEAEEHSWEEYIQTMVVKQMRPEGGLGLRIEAELQKWLCSTGSEHFPRIYKGPVRSLGSGTRNMRIDSNRREVHRLFMEHLPAGDLHGYIRGHIHSCDPKSRNLSWISESEIWSMFDCLVKAAMVMELGRESPGPSMAGADAERPLVHFDMKPENVFVGKQDSGEHNLAPILKTGDFGLARRVLPIQLQTAQYVETLKGRGTRGWQPPEQTRGYLQLAGMPNLRYSPVSKNPYGQNDNMFGSHTNIYGIGEIMYCLMTLSRDFDWLGKPYVSQLSDRLSRGETLGHDVEDGIYHPRHPKPQHQDLYDVAESGGSSAQGDPRRIMLPYSKLLKACVLECLMQEWYVRPSLVVLHDTIAAARNALKAVEPSKHKVAVATEPLRPERWIADFDLATMNAIVSSDASVEYTPLPEVIAKQDRDKLRTIQIVRARDFLGQELPVTMEKEIRERVERYDQDLEAKRRIYKAANRTKSATAKICRLNKIRRAIVVRFSVYEPVEGMDDETVTRRYIEVNLTTDMTIGHVKSILAGNNGYARSVPFHVPNMVLAPAKSVFALGKLALCANALDDADRLGLHCDANRRTDARDRRGALEVRQKTRRLIEDDMEV